jgi:hypothetical protein
MLNSLEKVSFLTIQASGTPLRLRLLEYSTASLSLVTNTLMRRGTAQKIFFLTNHQINI